MTDAPDDNVIREVKFAADADDKNGVLDLLRRMTDRALSNEVDTAFVLIKQTDGTWMFDWRGKAWSTDMIGRLEIAKAELVQAFIKSVT